MNAQQMRDAISRGDVVYYVCKGGDGHPKRHRVRVLDTTRNGVKVKFLDVVRPERTIPFGEIELPFQVPPKKESPFKPTANLVPKKHALASLGEVVRAHNPEIPALAVVVPEPEPAEEIHAEPEDDNMDDAESGLEEAKREFETWRDIGSEIEKKAEASKAELLEAKQARLEEIERMQAEVARIDAEIADADALIKSVRAVRDAGKVLR